MTPREKIKNEFKEKIETLKKSCGEDLVVSFNDFNKQFPKDSLDYDDALAELSEAGITVCEEEDEDLDDINPEDIEDPDFQMSDEEEEVDLENFDSLPPNITVDDPVRMYLKEIGSFQLLTYEEETKLSEIIAKGKVAQTRLDDIELCLEDDEMDELQHQVEVAQIAKNKLIEANYRLVVSIAKKYMNRGLLLLDLIQEGNMGLMKAVDKFDYEKGFKFSTYATWWIRQAITRAVADQARTIRIPVHMVETINKLVRTQRQLVQELSREPLPEEVAERMGLSVEKIQQIQKIAQEPISLEAPVGEEEDSSLGDFISDPTALDPYKFTKNEMLSRDLDDLLKSLTDREEKVLRMRFGLMPGDKKYHTLEEVGKEFGVTRERIRQIEAKALRKLRHPSRSKRLREYLKDDE